MRVTNSMKLNTSLNGISSNLKKFMTSVNQGNTGKKVTKPSDNAFDIGDILISRKDIKYNEQYQKNIDEVSGHLNMTDSSLRNMTDMLHRVKELALQASNDIVTQEGLNAIASEISQIKKEIGTIANTKYNGKYIFGGIELNMPPYDETLENWQLPESAMKDILIDVDCNTSISMNVNGSNIFNGTGNSRNIFDLLSDLDKNLIDGDYDSIRNRLNEIDDCIDSVLFVQADVGAKINRIDIISTKIEDCTVLFKENLSNKEDADLTEVIINMTESENAYNASLAISNKLMSLSILNFMN